MKKRLIMLTGLGLLLALGAVARQYFRPSPVWLSVSSPNKTYTVQLTGSKKRPIIPVGENEARFNLLKGGEPVVKNAYVDSYDWFDPSFAEKYPEHRWVTESIVRFGYKLSDPEMSLDQLTVSNFTEKPVRYLKITAGDTLFAFDLPPGSNIKLAVPRPSADQSWIAAEGMFADGHMIPFNGVNFPFPNNRTAQITYCLWVDDSVTQIASPVMDGYNGDATAAKPNVLRVDGCDSRIARP